MKVSPRIFQNGIPDEFPFSIAMIKTGIYPHIDGWTPGYWENLLHKRLDAGNGVSEMYKQYYFYSMGGAMTTPPMKKFYNNLVRYYGNKYGIKYLFEYRDKNKWVSGRHQK